MIARVLRWWLGMETWVMRRPRPDPTVIRGMGMYRDGRGRWWGRVR